MNPWLDERERERESNKALPKHDINFQNHYHAFKLMFVNMSIR